MKMYGINTTYISGLVKTVGEENGWLPEDSFENIIFSSAGLKADLLLIYLWSS